MFVSLFFYVLFAGADFGAGILELFSSRKNKELTKTVAYRVIGPVWEANHVWLILVMVILWVAFPGYFNILAVQLHIPLTMLLLGIIARGTAFVFRQYDAIKDPKSQAFYNAVFRISSVFTPFVLGTTAGAFFSGNLQTADTIQYSSFFDAFILPWWNVTALSIGVFCVAIFSFIAAAFLVGETDGDVRKIFVRRGLKALVVMVLSGLMVFVFDAFREAQLVQGYFSDWKVLVMLAVSGVLLFPLWSGLKNGNRIKVRILVGVQVLLVLGAWVVYSFPNLILTRQGSLSILEGIPGDAVYKWMGIALIVGSCFILPGLFHLFKMFGLIFKEEKDDGS